MAGRRSSSSSASRARSTISPREYRALAEIRYRLRCFLVFSEAAARSAGVEPQQHQLLLAIKGLALDARPTIGAIAERLQIQHHSAVELTKRAVRAGLIERRTSEADRREALLVITPKGQAILGRLSVAHRDELRVEGSELLRALRALVGKPRKKETR